MARVLSNRIEAVEYIHAADGLPYRHRFGKGSRVELNGDGSVTIRNPRKRLWADFDLSTGTTQPFLENPPMAKRKRARRATAGSKRKATRTRRAASKRRTAARHTNPKGGIMAKAKSRKRRRRNPQAGAAHRGHAARRVTRRRRRRNPPGGATFSTRNIVNHTIDAAINGGVVVIGMGAGKVARSQFGYGPGTVVGAAIQAGVGLAGSILGARFIGADRARFFAAGAVAGAYREILKDATKDLTAGGKNPWLTEALGDGADTVELIQLPRSYVNAGDVVGDYAPPSLGGYAPPSLGAAALPTAAAWMQ